MKGAVSELIHQQLLALRLRKKLWDSLAACGVSDWALFAERRRRR